MEFGTGLHGPGARPTVASLPKAQYERLMARLLDGMLLAPVPPRTEEQMRWEDDGGPPFADGYTHTIGAAR